MMKKWYLLLITGILLASMLIPGCTTKKEQVTVTFSYPPYGYDSNKETTFWTKYIAEFEKANPGIKIAQTVESWDNVLTKWEEAFVSGNTADIGYLSPMATIGYALRGKLLPVTDVVQNLGGEKAFTAPCLYFKENGEWWGVPNCDASIVLAYRKDLLQQAGFSSPPKNWDELVAIAQATTANGNYGLGIYTGENVLTNQILGCFMEASGGMMLDSKGNVVINSPENLRAMKFMVDLVNTYKVVPASASDWKYGDDANVIGIGKIAMDFMWGGYGTLLESMFPNDYQNIGFAKLPDGPSGHSGSSSGTGGFIVFKNAKHPAEAKKFIEYMSRAEISKEWCIISGNVSPFVNVANDPELAAYEWYKAMADQAPTAVTPGWDYGIVPGMDIVDNNNVFARAFNSVIQNKKTAEQALADMHQEVIDIMEQANKQVQ
jgi:multiple sugar transport system substrate-binding protein